MTRLDTGLAEDLDNQARALDTLTLSATDQDGVARAAVRRRVFLADLLAAALPGSAELEAAGYSRLAGYVRAVEARDAYLASGKRPAPGPAGEVEVSLDWFRLGSPVPAGEDPDAWLARWEQVLGSEPVGPGVAGYALIREGGGWYRLEWRRDDGERPALLRVEAV
jgi:hypothetical protein